MPLVVLYKCDLIIVYNIPLETVLVQVLVFLHLFYSADRHS